MAKSLLGLLILCLGSCSTLMSAGAAGAGAALGSLAGPGGAAVGAAGGVVAVELIEGEVPVEVIGTGPAATIHETTSLVETIGLWYLLIFVFLPLLTKRGRGWVQRFLQLHDTVSKKDVDIQQSRLDKLESLIEKEYSDAQSVRRNK